jgi:hypothetical protein
LIARVIVVDRLTSAPADKKTALEEEINHAP